MNPTEHTPIRTRAITGLFGTLGGLLRTRGTGARSATGARTSTAAPGTATGGRVLIARALIVTTTCALLAAGLLFTGAASAAVTHEYEKPLSEVFSEGVPKGCVKAGEPPIKEPPEGPCISGPAAPSYGDVSVSGGRLWLSDSLAGHSRVDAFNPQTGALVPPQLDEAEGVGGFGAMGVAEAFGSYPQLAYVQASGGVAVFEVATGKLVGKWSGAATADGAFANGTQRVAVDGLGGLDPASGDVYVTNKATEADPQGNVVDVFSPKKAELEGKHAGEEPGTVLAELHGTCEEPGELVTGATPCEHSPNPAIVPFTGRPEAVVSPKNGDLVVVDNGVLDLFEPGVMGSYTFVRRITEAEGSPLSSNVHGLAVDGNGDMYVAYQTVVDQFSELGALLFRFEGTPGTAFSELGGVGVDPGHHNVFIGNLGSPSVVVYGPTTVVPDVTTAPATELHATHVQLHGTVKLDGEGPAACVFEYGTSTSYGSETPCEPSPVTAADEVGGEPATVQATIKGLSPDTTYFYRVNATNKSGLPSREGPQDKGEVTTTGPGLHGESVSEVSSSAASLGATIDPNGVPTSYYFQYVNPATEGISSTEACPPTGTAKCPTLPATPEALGSVPGDQTVSQRVQGLSPGHEYHYRVVVVSEPPGKPAETFTEPDKTFTTEPPASGFALPDGREWELVTPPDKHGATPRQRVNGVTQASVSGGAISYLTTKPTEEDAPGFGVIFVQVLSTRGKGGWESQDISAPHAEPPAVTAGTGLEYRTFSEDLSSALVTPYGEFTSLRPDVFPPDTERTPYLRHDLTCASTPSTCYEPLLTEAPGYADVPAGTHFGAGGELRGGWDVMAATPELTYVILSKDKNGSSLPLKQGAPSGSLYEWSAGAPFGEGQLQLVTVLPDGTPTSGTIGAGERGKGNDARAVSRDGARVVWTQLGGGGGLYLTDMSLGRSVRLGSGIFQTMNNDGSRVFFTGAGNELYECAIVIEAGAPRCKSHPVAPGAGILGETIVGASEDGNYIYFVSNALVGGGVGHGAVNGNCGGNTGNSPKEEWARATPATACNLYMVHYDSATGWEPPALVGVLSGDDESAWSIFEQKAARVSPNGQWLAFMSNRSLTGYDNRDAHSGKPDEEVFLYHVGLGGGAGSLVCASCDPTGARPTGFEVGNSSLNRVAIGGEWPEYAWLAGTIPGWTGYELSTSLYQSRYLFDSGRLFFNSSDALVPQDINNQVDVYEFEPAVGAGGGSESSSEPPPNDSCTTGSSTYNSATGGCVSLISSGTSHQESGFYDASATGDDVFFVTAESLVAQDPGGALSVYDAHVCGAEGVPCTQGAVSPPECTTADACRAAPAPQPGIFGAPASATFSGPGNLAPAVVVKKATLKTVKCKRGFVKNKHNKCIRNKSKHKAKKSAHTNRRTK
jgi:hypothetical protein